MPASRALILSFLAAAIPLAAQTPPQQQAAKPPATSSGSWVMGSAPAAPVAATATPTPTAATKRLPDPSPAQIQQIIQTFTTHEREFRGLLANNYTYTESILVEELNDSGDLEPGNFQQVNEIQYAPSGARSIVCTFCPQNTLQNVTLTQEDLTDMFNMNMYTISVDELPQYKITYVDHEPLDQITAYVFDIAPKEIVKGHRYFQGKVYVDDQSQMIVKSIGKVVPDEYDKHGVPTNEFLPFTVWRQEVDGKYWFPVYTLMQGSLKFPGQPDQPMQMVIQFKNYKQFRATTRIISVRALPDSTKPDDKTKKPPVPTIPH